MEMREIREIEIPIPGRNIAAKDWGPLNGRPVLALHGWQDNAATFDTLIPLLPDYLRVVAIDFTGHGLSDHKPRGYSYQALEHSWELKPIVSHLKWSRFTILAHSMGALTGMVYASLFPQEVVQIVSIDTIKPPTADLSKICGELAAGISLHWQLETKFQEQPPVYTEREALHRMMEGFAGSLTEDSARVLMKRGTKPVPGGLVFTRDMRLRGSYSPKLDVALYRAFFANLNCELLIIMASKSMIRVPPDTMEDLKGVLRNACSFFEMVWVEGTHHVHLNNPERVAPLVTRFLARATEYSKL